MAQDKAINAKADTSDLEAAAASASAWITGNKGGYVVLRRNADGQPYPYKYFPCSFAFILPIQFDVSYLSNYILIL